MAWMRYHGDGTEASFEGLRGAHGESLRRVRSSGSAFRPSSHLSYQGSGQLLLESGNELRFAGGGADEKRRLGETGFFCGS